MRLLLISLLLSLFQNDYAQEFIYAQQAGGSFDGNNFNDAAHSIALDHEGNVFITGDVIGASGMNAVFGKGQPNETTLTINGMFVAKYNPSGQLLWVRQGGSITGYGITTDKSGNCYVTGKFSNQALFGEGQPNETVLDGTFGEIFIAKYDLNGYLLWAKSAGGSKDGDSGFSIVTDAASGVYITGSIEDGAIFGKGEVSEKTVTDLGYKIFAAKYSSDGNFLWVHVLATGQGNGLSIAVDKNSNVVLCGGDGNSFVLSKLTNNGLLVWSIIPFTESAGGVHGLTIDSEDNIYLTGDFWGSATFGTGPNKIILTGLGVNDFFIAKYKADGQNVWAKSAGGPGFDRGLSVAMDFQNSVYVTGYFNDELTFASKNAVKLIGDGDFDMFVAKYTYYGDLLWATNSGGTGNEEGKGIAVDSEGNSYVAGYFNSKNLVFGKGETAQQTFSASGFNDIYYSKFKASTDYILSASGEGSDIDWKIFPNPGLNEITLTMNLQDTGPIRIWIRDCSGKEIINTSQFPNSNEHTARINLSGQPSGLYLIHLQTGSSNYYKKFIKSN